MADPDHLGLGARLYTAFLGTTAGRWIALNIAPKVDPWLMRVTRGHLGMALMLPSTLLTTVGAQSRVLRTSAVLFFRDGDDVIVVASSFGRDRHPAWYHNLKANPHVHVGVGDGAVAMTAAEVRDPDELVRLWARADRIYPLFPDYRGRAAVSGRTIPIIRLSAS
ncbi:nitroreductase/quinone reductase family protein [Mycobacterium sp. 3519A]|uniref:nitroreductase/quinone reductase family protein n=1 Tax=Mycobacterium sp. 3519A TaxID=2057184 RepID=UPI000C7AF1E1|nr:nitroreductase/quinone reductase family protein [Mycobacterium sp. 3519A]